MLNDTKAALPSSEDDSSEYRVAVAALIVSGAAFAIAFVQVMMQYSTSSPAHGKYTYEATARPRGIQNSDGIGHSGGFPTIILHWISHILYVQGHDERS
jgi:hypothetical protein